VIKRFALQVSHIVLPDELVLAAHFVVRTPDHLQLALVEVVVLEPPLQRGAAVIPALDHLELALALVLLRVLKGDLLLTTFVAALGHTEGTLRQMVLHVTSLQADVAAVLVDQRLLEKAGDHLVLALRVHMVDKLAAFYHLPAVVLTRDQALRADLVDVIVQRVVLQLFPSVQNAVDDSVLTLRGQVALKVLPQLAFARPAVWAEHLCVQAFLNVLRQVRLGALDLAAFVFALNHNLVNEPSHRNIRSQLSRVVP